MTMATIRGNQKEKNRWSFIISAPAADSTSQAKEPEAQAQKSLPRSRTEEKRTTPWNVLNRDECPGL
jgi:hypothetical protein